MCASAPDDHGTPRMNGNLEFRLSSIFCRYRLNCDQPVAIGGGNRGARRKPPPYARPLAAFSHNPAEWVQNYSHLRVSSGF